MNESIANGNVRRARGRTWPGRIDRSRIEFKRFPGDVKRRDAVRSRIGVQIEFDVDAAARQVP